MFMMTSDLIQDILPVRSQLFYKGISLNSICPMCGKGVENLEHLFVHYDYSQDIWKAC